MLKDRISYCIYNATKQKDIVPCIEKCLDDCYYEDKQKKNIGLSLEDIFEITYSIINICEIRNFELKYVFMELWWSKNPFLNKVGSFLMQKIYDRPHPNNILSIVSISKRIKDLETANYFSYNIAQIINKNIKSWKQLIIELFLHENIWVNYAAANILLLLAQRHANSTATIIQIIKKIKFPLDTKTMQKLETVLENISYHLNITVLQ